ELKNRTPWAKGNASLNHPAGGTISRGTRPTKTIGRTTSTATSDAVRASRASAPRSVPSAPSAPPTSSSPPTRSGRRSHGPPPVLRGLGELDRVRGRVDGLVREREREARVVDEVPDRIQLRAVRQRRQDPLGAVQAEHVEVLAEHVAAPAVQQQVHVKDVVVD